MANLRGFVRPLSAGAAVVLCGLWAGPARAQEQGKPFTLPERGITETVEQIMARQAKERPWSPEDGIQVFEEFRLPDTTEWDPNAPNVPFWPWKPGVSPITRGAGDQNPWGGAGGGPFLPQTVGTSFTGGTEVNALPPDSMAAVGPDQVLCCVNLTIKVFSKAGVLGGLNAGTGTFFASVTNNQGTSDPQVRFDPISQRWFVTMITTAANSNRILLAVSSGSHITNSSSFTFFGFNQDADGGQPTAFADHDKTGVDANAVVVGCNMFTGASGGTVWVINKASVLSGGPLTFTSFRNLTTVRTPNGVDNDDPAATQSYVLGTNAASGSILKFRRISNPGGTPTISGDINVTVPAWTSPQTQPAAGSSFNLDAIDERLAYVQAHKDRFSGQTRIVAAHNIRVSAAGNNTSPERNAIRWYQVQNVTGTPSLVQSGNLFDNVTAQSGADRKGYWMGAAAMSGQGHIAIGSSEASASTDHAQVAVAGRLRGDTLGTTQAPTIAQTSATAYNQQSGGTQRWGDYAMMSVDPNDDQTMWAAAEFTNASGTWSVRCVQLKAPPPATPASCSPPNVSQGASNVNVVVTGTSSSGSEFFDADNTHPNHIAASISGTGVTVNSVTWSSATPLQATVNVSVTGGATLGARNVTITNPDGQQATGVGILTIDNGSTCPSFTQNPTGAILCQGANTSFTVAATGNPAPTFQWRHNTVNLTDGGSISGSTTTTLSINGIQPGDAGSYDCVATNACGSTTSNSANLSVTVPPSISVQPSDQAVTAVYHSATFSVTAGGTSPSYQWRKNGTNLTDGGSVSGSTTSTLTFNPADISDNGSTIDCFVSNGCGGLFTNAANYTVFCVADFNHDGFVNGDDFDAFSALFDIGDPGADINNDAFVNGDDFDAFSAAFDAGC